MKLVPTLLAGLVVLLAGCGGDDAALPTGSEEVSLDPAEFTTEIDNPFWPMAPGTRWVYRETDSEGAEQRIVVTVTHETREVLGIETVVVHDLVTEGGVPVEDTYDGTPRTRTAVSGTSVRTRRSTRTAWSSPRRVRGRQVWTVLSLGSSCRRRPRSG